MKIEVAKTEKYSLVVDAAKNRIYVTMIGLEKPGGSAEFCQRLESRLVQSEERLYGADGSRAANAADAGGERNVRRAPETHHGRRTSENGGIAE